MLQRQQPQIQGDPQQLLGRWRLEAQGSIRRHGEEPQDEKRWSFAGEESNSQGEVRWALFSRMCLKAGWEKQLRFSSLRDYLSLTFHLSSVPLLQGSVLCWLIHNTQPKRPILQRGQESSKVTTKPLQSSGDRSPLPTPHPILTFPHRPVTLTSQESATQPMGWQTSPSNDCLAQTHTLSLAAWFTVPKP